jgi:hypothetical protein
MTNNLMLQTAIGVFLLLVIGIAITVYEFTYNEGPRRKKKKNDKK